MKRIRGGASFLTRLARDVRGNTIAIAAAAMLPLAGMIGGGVDMSRLYLTKTRLQQACDAGALAGRKAMGTGAWTTTGAGNSNTRATELFVTNFKDGAYGTGTLTKTFSESTGVVTGEATVAVPMTIMRVFGMTTRSLTVKCTAKMEIPNTDVMFVLDNTGSMNCVAGDTSCTNNGGVPAVGSKIDGIKSAVKCFYEALLKVNTSEVCGNDPTATTYTQTAQIRFGFVPYTVNVNVGKLLANSSFADTWTYQSRVAKTTVVQAWTAGTESARSTPSNWSPAITPSTYNNASAFSGFTTPSSNQTVGSTTYSRQLTTKTSTTCPAMNTLAGSGTTLIAMTDSPGTTSTALTGTTNNPPTYPSTTPQTLTYTETDPRAVYAYRYIWKKVGSTTSCWLEVGTATYDRTRTSTSTKSITWTPYDRFDNWIYKAVSNTPISGLKAGGSSWNGSVSLPLATTTSPSVRLSGSTTSASLTLVANTNVTWDGCLEERQTVPNSDGDPSDEWSPIPTAALDMDIDRLPTPGSPETLWGPVLNGAVWGRYSGSTSSYTRSDVATSSNLNRNDSYYCPTAAKKMQTWYTPSSFETYVNSLDADGNTYHDIGMIWGARLISPTGIFASENATTPTGGPIQRHIIFMTDGDTNSQPNDYAAYGIGWWDRRQTTYAPNATNLGNIIDARLTALCTAIKNKNITLWVISYGGGINATTESRLQTCATPGKYFSAANTPALVDQFKQIAAQIADLRLTS